MHTVTPSGVELCYDTFGDPARPPLVLVNGLGGQLVGWRPELCALLADAGFHVVRFDNRDVGRSQKFATGYSLATMAEDTAGLLTALGIDAAHVVGQSMGGMIAQHLVLDHADRVRSLALVYTASSIDRTAAAVMLTERRERPRSRAEAVAAYLVDQEPCRSPGFPQDVAWLRELGGVMYDRDPDGGGRDRQLQAAMRSPDLTAQLAAITVPTAVVHGDGDLLVPPAASAVLHERIPHSTLTVLPGMGHELPRPLWPELVAAITASAVR